MASPSLRYAGFYGAVFLALGVYLPFWPLWLESRGLGAAEIGLLLALNSWLSVVTTPALAQVSDRSGRAKTTLAVLAGLSLIAFAGFHAAGGFWQILALQLLSVALFQALVPLGESQAITAVYRQRLDYGRVRLWGSLTFIVGALGCGRLIADAGPDLVLALVLGALAATFLAALALPAGPAAARGEPRGRLKDLLARRFFLLLLLTVGLLQASHAVYYGFSALHWRAAGHSSALIGLLWAEGVIAEVLLFAVAGRLFSGTAPAWLLVGAGLSGVARWSLTGASSELAVLLVAQLLHAGTFGLAHLGAIHAIARAAPPGLAASAQSLYAALSGGLAMGLAMLAAGRLFDAYAGGAFYVMASLSAGGMVFALLLTRR